MVRTQTTENGDVREVTLQKKVRASRLKWSVPFLAAFMPIILLSVYSFQVSSNSVKLLVEEENISASGNLAQLIVQDIKQNVRLAHAIASIPGTTKAVQGHDEVALRTRLKAIMVSNPQVHRAFVVDTEGVLWSEFPTAIDAYGADLSDLGWFRSVKEKNMPYISGLYIRPQFPDDPVVAIAVPILTKGEFLGVLVFEYRVAHLSRWLSNVRLGIRGHMLLLDQHGSLIAHPTIAVGKILVKDYIGIEAIDRAHKGELHTSEYIEPTTKEEMIATFLPISVGGNKWVVVAQQPKVEAFALLNEVKKNLGIAGGVLTFFTLIMVIALARMGGRIVKLNQELGNKNQALKDFTSIVSHQLKAPITAMRWNIEMILDGDYGEISADLREIMEDLHEVNISNYHLVMEILNVSRLDRGVVEVKLTPLPLAEIAQRAVRDYKEAAKRAGLYLKVEGEVETFVMTDLEKTAESITNAISNAIKYTKKGGITVTLSDKNGMGTIEVADTGDGMDSEMIEKLFSRTGVKKSNTGAESSSGLGLFIAKKFMKMQGGDVTVSSEVSKGTTFTYTLPLASQKDIDEFKNNKDTTDNDSAEEAN
ncbi:MAG: sensor histidine kinase [Candidatus Peribacter sp.]|jgi:signal transduction histidine kinase|nr:sensor histidine kinase [Candidatus Peribacter sp.]MBT4392634.1 sensor histidine kinase [Candidatus Peribacter sp.]MBT4601097.1 sensor histidine kinase [Candidatus Peribacter sp.]MBT5149496.1 sensor histidine kinase [Candidatus Peribacter sp.]MBT5638657.1 sensor histidine kinase [Candidatus Peribacter sp.]